MTEKPNKPDVTYPVVATYVDSAKDGTVVLNSYTELRKQHTDGKWYRWVIRYTQEDVMAHTIKDATMDNVCTVYGMAYEAMLFGVIDPSLKTDKGLDVFELDPIQESEKERVGKILGRSKEEIGKI